MSWPNTTPASLQASCDEAGSESVHNASSSCLLLTGEHQPLWLSTLINGSAPLINELMELFDQLTPCTVIVVST